MSHNSSFNVGWYLFSILIHQHIPQLQYSAYTTGFSQQGCLHLSGSSLRLLLKPFWSFFSFMEPFNPGETHASLIFHQLVNSVVIILSATKTILQILVNQMTQLPEFIEQILQRVNLKHHSYGLNEGKATPNLFPEGGRAKKAPQNETVFSEDILSQYLQTQAFYSFE